MLNIPNGLTVLRLVLGVVFFVLFTREERGYLDAALAVFLLAGITDFLDGYLARAWHLETDFGRVTDPVVDKILIAGAFILAIGRDAGVEAWMVVVIVAREFLIGNVRELLEGRGTPFGSLMAGKGKLVVQFVAVCAVVLYLGHGRDVVWAHGATRVCVWLAVAATVLSGLVYLARLPGGTGETPGNRGGL
ncbi:MAG: CDP-diacylglycerol--glycerol-3-phosphate 3-phosphatidyltransferase [Planctomycetota bacterium]